MTESKPDQRPITCPYCDSTDTELWFDDEMGEDEKEVIE
jgi:hypothetical protein